MHASLRAYDKGFMKNILLLVVVESQGKWTVQKRKWTSPKVDGPGVAGTVSHIE